MEFREKKRGMLYKNNGGGRIMVRITLPRAIEECEMNSFYDAIGEKYLSCAASFINGLASDTALFLDVSYELEENEKEIKIKRLSTLREGGKTLKFKILSDLINKSDLKLKK